MMQQFFFSIFSSFVTLSSKATFLCSLKFSAYNSSIIYMNSCLCFTLSSTSFIVLINNFSTSFLIAIVVLQTCLFQLLFSIIVLFGVQQYWDQSIQSIHNHQTTKKKINSICCNHFQTSITHYINNILPSEEDNEKTSFLDSLLSKRCTSKLFDGDDTFFLELSSHLDAKKMIDSQILDLKRNLCQMTCFEQIAETPNAETPIAETPNAEP